MNRILAIFLITILFCSFTNAQNYKSKIDSLNVVLSSLEQSKLELESQLESYKLKWVSQQIKSTAIPELSDNEKVIHHSAMSLSYNEEYDQNSVIKLLGLNQDPFYAVVCSRL